MRLRWSLMALICLPHALPGQTADSAAPRKQAVAVRITGSSPRIDGRLDDAVWRQARFFSDFIQKEPVEGAVPSESTMVGVLYNDDAIYIGARMYAVNPAAIQRNVARRDQGLIQSEHIWFSFDSYRDRRTAYSFGVTAGGGRMDWYHPTDDEGDLDGSFDPVYDARVQIDSLGWTAELRIPFSQLRFRRQDVQVWGFNVDRWIPSKVEDIFWIPVPRGVTAWSSRMGELVGIEGIRPSRRIEIVPYAAGEATLASDPDPANPFDPTGRTTTARVGGDLKLGIGPNLTAEAAVNPDFGQVEADPAVVNLSAFETFFDERRPFFIEGSELLEGNGPGYYYSRRIGATPPGAAGGDYVSRPQATTILGAGKLTGRLSHGLSIGAVAAVTGREYARTYDSTAQAFGRTEVAPVSGYGVLRLSQQFGANQSTAGLSLTFVERDAPVGTALAQRLNRRAVAGGVDWDLRFGDGYYVLAGFLGFSAIQADSAAIARQQLSSRRYFQRPDQTYVRYDPARTSLSGYTAGLSFEKISGRHWLYDVEVGLESPGLELNDAGQIQTADGINAGAEIVWRETRPGRRFRSYRLTLGADAEWNYGGDRQQVETGAEARFTFLNQTSLALGLFAIPRYQDMRLTRGGPSMGSPGHWSSEVQLSGNPAAKTVWQASLDYQRGQAGFLAWRVAGALSVRPGPRWLVSLTPAYEREDSPRQYVTTLDDTLATSTYGSRYIFAGVDQSEWRMRLRFNYAFTPDLTMEVYAEPFIASGRFHDLGELPRPRAYDLRIYGRDPGTTIARDSTGAWQVGADGTTFTLDEEDARDFTETSFRSNVVLRWEWRRGSTLYLVWQQNRGDELVRGRRVRLGELFEGLRADGANFFAVKATYWLAAR